MNWKLGATETRNVEIPETQHDNRMMTRTDEQESHSSSWMEGHVTVLRLTLSNRLRNRRIKSINGNGMKGIVKILHWHLGARFWHRKRADIEALI